TPLDDFDIERGEEIVERESGARTYIGGMLAACAEIGAEAIPIFAAEAQPSGAIAAAAYDAMKEDLLSGLRAALPVDAVALALHGAGIAEEIDDIEGDLCAEVRALVGPGVPIV